MNGLPLNRALRDEGGETYDIVAGTFLVVGLSDDNFDSLTPEQSAKFAEHFKTPEVFIKHGSRLVVLPIYDGTEAPAQPPKRYHADEDAALRGALTNLGKYNEGELDFKWISFPISDEDLETVKREIGIDGVRYEEYFMSDYDCQVDGLYDHLGEYDSIRALNALGERLESMSASEIKHYEAVLEVAGASNISELINITHNLDCWDFLPEIENDHDLGYYWIEESGSFDTAAMGKLARYIDYEQFGRDVRLEESGDFVGGGYVYANGNSMDQVYDPVHGYGEQGAPAFTEPAADRGRDGR